MEKDSRSKMIESAVKLIRTRGLSAASFSEVLADSGAPMELSPRRFRGYQLWTAALDRGDMRKIFAASHLHTVETAKSRNGKTAKTMFETDTLGFEQAWTQLSTSCAGRRSRA